MEALVHAAVIYGFLLVVFAVAGKRSLAEMDTFDLVLLLIISEGAQSALTAGNNSLIFSIVLIVTLVALEMSMGWLRKKIPKIDHVLQGGPLILVADGRIFRHRMHKESVTDQDILATARQTHGLERMDQIKYAILETTGNISIIPKKGESP